MPDVRLHVERIISMPFDENTYVAHRADSGDNPAAGQCLVFDPGFDPDAIIGYLEQQALTPAALVITHGHSDHIGGNTALKRRWPDCPIVIGSGDAPKLTDPELNLSAAFGAHLVSPPADRTVDEPERFTVAGITLEVLSTPGHSAGHVVFLCRDTAPWQVFGGDVLFHGSIGRTDFPDGNFDDLRDAIHNKLFTLPDETIILPGHGPETTVGHEKRSNPFVGAPSGYNVG